MNIVHLSTRRGLELVRAARGRVQRAYVDTCPRYLLLDENKYRLAGFESAKFVLSPLLRSLEDQNALWMGLEAGELDTIGTDRCSFHFRGVKELGREDFSQIPNGIPGVEHRPALMYTAGVASGHISAHQLMKLLPEQPARLFGMDECQWRSSIAGQSEAEIDLLYGAPFGLAPLFVTAS